MKRYAVLLMSGLLVWCAPARAEREWAELLSELSIPGFTIDVFAPEAVVEATLASRIETLEQTMRQNNSLIFRERTALRRDKLRQLFERAKKAGRAELILDVVYGSDWRERRVKVDPAFVAFSVEELLRSRSADLAKDWGVIEFYRETRQFSPAGIRLKGDPKRRGEDGVKLRFRYEWLPEIASLYELYRASLPAKQAKALPRITIGSFDSLLGNPPAAPAIEVVRDECRTRVAKEHRKRR